MAGVDDSFDVGNGGCVKVECKSYNLAERQIDDCALCQLGFVREARGAWCLTDCLRICVCHVGKRS